MHIGRNAIIWRIFIANNCLDFTALYRVFCKCADFHCISISILTPTILLFTKYTLVLLHTYYKNMSFQSNTAFYLVQVVYLAFKNLASVHLYYFYEPIFYSALRKKVYIAF